MANVHKPDENMRADSAFVYATLNNSGNAAVYYDMKNYDLCWFLIHVHTNAGLNGSLSCQMWQRVGALGATATLKVAVTVTAVGVDDSLFARGEDFATNTGYTHVGVICTEGNTAPVNTSGIIVRLRARHKRSVMLA